MGDTALTGIAVIAGMGIGMIKDYEKIIEGNRQLRWQYEAREEGTENLEKYGRLAERYLQVMECLGPVYKERW